MPLSLHTAPTDAPITVAEARGVHHVDGTADDFLIGLAIAQAVEDAEHIMKRAVMPQKWQLTLPCFEAVLTLQRPKVTQVDSLQYIDSTGQLATLAPEAYQLAAASDYTATVTPAYGTSWPVTRQHPEAVRVVFSCGYTNAGAVPASIKAWILLRVGALIENRSAWTQGKAIEFNPNLDHLLDRFKVITF